ncbi:MAG TPA: hypothetical protein VH682_15685 [Gemmataceae bacterium]|jgi:uncharacterized protein (TIGR03066 family)
MQLPRCILVGCLIVGLTGLSSYGGAARAAEEASNKDKIIGVWQITKGGDKTPKDATFEFTKDGKVKMTAVVDGRKVTLEATYSVEGNKLKTVGPGPGGKKVEDTDTIEKLTDTEMILKDAKGKVVEFKKKKK